MISNTKLVTPKFTYSTRIVLPPMATAKSADGIVTDDLINYYTERALNPHVGTIITEHSFITLAGKASINQVSVADDSVISGLKKLTDALHSAKPELKIFCQINHAGGKANPEITGLKNVSASETEYKYGTAHALTKEEIKTITKEFADSARRVKEAGFDGVEIHSAHGYLLNQFYSPLSNKREDEYGPQCMENRLRFLKEVIEEVRKTVGDNYPVAVRLGGCDYTEGGSTEEDAKEAAKLLESYGIDLLDVSGGHNGYIRSDYKEAGTFASMTQKIKEVTSIPVITTGAVKTLKEAEELLNNNAADLVGVGRALLADAHWEN